MSLEKRLCPRPIGTLSSPCQFCPASFDPDVPAVQPAILLWNEGPA